MKETYAALFVAVLLAGLFPVFAGCTGTDGMGPEQTATPSATVAAVNETEIETEAVENIVDANNIFAFDMYRQIAGENTDDENIFFSPFSISSAFALTYEGARGDTAEEIGTVFHFPDNIATLRTGFLAINTGINAGDPGYDLDVVNALWAEKTDVFLEDYISTADTYYSANVTNLDFLSRPEKSRLIINDWAEEKTNGKIEDLIPQGMINSDTSLVITNAVYFMGKWVTQFDKNETHEGYFTTSSGDTVKVDMMYRDDKDAIYDYAETDDLQALRMPYNNESGTGYSMVVILPKGNDLQRIEETLDQDLLKKIEDSMESKRVIVSFPKFKLETEYNNLSGTLADMGMPIAFSGSADFSGMDGTYDLSISDVVHKAYVEVNEEGTEAAAATAVIMQKGVSGEVGPFFSADHPFIFLIQDDATGNIIFMGRVSNPACT